MKKISIVLGLTLLLVSLFATVALADQTHPVVNGVYLPADASAIHSGYTVNTDACSSCHSIHNAQESEYLLQWASPSEACMACHDGSVTATYNVEGGEIAATGADTKGGSFAVRNGGTTASEHGVFGGTLLYTAPGGKGAADLAAPASGADSKGAWDVAEEFQCSSCHDPHGTGGNFRLLNPNPNLVMSQGQPGSSTTPYYGLTGVKLGAFVDLGTQAKFPFSAASYVSGTTKLGDGTDAVTVSGKNKPKMGDRGLPQKVWIDTNLVDPTKYTIGEEAGNAYVLFTSDPGFVGNVLADYTPVMQVAATISNKLQVNESIVYGAGMYEFCTACHTDYYGSRSSSQAVYDTQNKYHHTGNRANSSGNATFAQLGNYTGIVSGAGSSTGSCLTCHFAHGVDQERWAKVATAVSVPEYNSPELAGSSALKRLPNMGVCEVCHKKEFASYSANNKYEIRNGATVFK